MEVGKSEYKRNAYRRGLVYEVSEKGKGSIGNWARDHPQYTLIRRIWEARSFLRGGRKGVALREREGGEEGRGKGRRETDQDEKREWEIGGKKEKWLS